MFFVLLHFSIVFSTHFGGHCVKSWCVCALSIQRFVFLFFRLSVAARFAKEKKTQIINNKLRLLNFRFNCVCVPNLLFEATMVCAYRHDCSVIFYLLLSWIITPQIHRVFWLMSHTHALVHTHKHTHAHAIHFTQHELFKRFPAGIDSDLARARLRDEKWYPDSVDNVINGASKVPRSIRNGGARGGPI